MKLIKFLPLLSAVFFGCQGDPVSDSVTGGSFSRTIGSGNGVCTKTAEEITPLTLDEKNHAQATLSKILNSGSLKTQSVRITIEVPTDKRGVDFATLSLSAVSRSGDDKVLTLSKSCAKNFTRTTGAEEPVEILVPISNKDGELVYNLYYVSYGPQFLTEEFNSRYMLLESVASDSDEFADPFGDEAPLSFEDILNEENSKVFIKKDDDGEIPDSFDDDTVAKSFTVTYFDEERRIRYHMNLLWTPPEEPIIEEPKLRVEDSRLNRTIN